MSNRIEKKTRAHITLSRLLILREGGKSDRSEDEEQERGSRCASAAHGSSLVAGGSGVGRPPVYERSRGVVTRLLIIVRERSRN